MLSRSINGIPFYFDEEHETLINAHVWSFDMNGYVRTRHQGTWHYLHRMIKQATPGTMIDHINQNKADNRTSNLRWTDYSLNRRNAKLNSNSTTKSNEIHMQPDGKFRARVHWKGKRLSAGVFSTLKEAEEARDFLLKQLL